MYIDISKSLRDEIAHAVKGSDPTVYQTECTFVNGDTGFEFTCRSVTGISICQDFESTYTDNITVTTKITIQEYRQILANMQDLMCSLILTPLKPSDLSVSLDATPIMIEMKVLMEEQVDLDKQNAVSQFMDEENPRPDTAAKASMLIDFTFNLISKEAHTIRQVAINSFFHNANLEVVLHDTCAQFSIPNAEIIPPDNTTTYPTLIIPPMMDFATIFGFLQARHGIYSKGLGYYFVNNTLYIYPAFDTKEDTSPTDITLHILNAPPSQFLGLDHYHLLEDKDLYVVSISKSQLKPRATFGAENVGTAHISINADSVRDEYLKIGQDGSIKRGENDITVVTMQNTASNTSKDMQNVRFIGENNNIYASTSAMAAINGTTLITQWVRAVPWMITPGQNVIYHYDSTRDMYKTQKGRILKVIYASETHGKGNTSPALSFTATLVVFLEPDMASEESIQLAGS